MATPAQELYGWFNKPPYASANEPFKDFRLKFRDYDDTGGKGKGKNKPVRIKLDMPVWKGPGSLKSRSANQDGYFEQTFKRAFEKEGPGRKSFSGPGGKGGKNMRVKMEQPPYIPPAPGKHNSGKGDYYGTFHGPYDRVDPRPRDQGPLIFEQRNFTTNPGKKGIGCGYHDVGLSKYPEYKSSPYQAATTMEANVKGKKGMVAKVKISDSPFYDQIHEQEFFDNGDCFRPPKHPVKASKAKKAGIGVVNFKQEKLFIPSNPGKKPGGCKDGGFSKWPNYYPADPYKRIGPEFLKDERNKEKILYSKINTTSPYSQRWTSHIQQVVKKEINTHTYRERAPKLEVYTFDKDWTRAEWNFKKGLVEC